MVSYERGERKELGHLQGISRLLTHESLKERIRRWMRLALLLASGIYRAKMGFAFFYWEDLGVHGRLRPEGYGQSALPLLRVAADRRR